MNEIPGSTFDVSQGMLRLGVVPEASLGWLSETTDTGDAAVFVQDGRLWYYDVPNNMMTCVFDMDSTQTDRYSGTILMALRLWILTRTEHCILLCTAT